MIHLFNEQNQSSQGPCQPLFDQSNRPPPTTPSTRERKRLLLAIKHKRKITNATNNSSKLGFQPHSLEPLPLGIGNRAKTYYKYNRDSRQLMQIVHGDLLNQDVEIIVNSWNMNFIPWWLLLPQGVSGQIKRQAGTKPFRQLAQKGILREGDAVLTEAGRLQYRGIVHVAGLNCFWVSNTNIVRRCVISALKIAKANNFRSIAFPLIGAGTGGVSKEQSLKAMTEAVKSNDFSGEVKIVIYRKHKSD